MSRRDPQTAQPRPAAGPEAAGFTLVELLIIVLVLGVLASIVVFALGGVASSSTRTACRSNARNVDVAAAAYLTEHPEVVQVTQGLLIAPGSGTLQSWPDPTNSNYTIVIAGDGNALTGTADTDHHTIAANDVVVEIGPDLYDATASVTSACANAS